MDRKVVNEINNIKERDRFIRGLRAWTGFKQIGVPYDRPERQFGYSTNNFFKNIRWAKKGIFSFSYLPLEFMSFIFVLHCSHFRFGFIFLFNFTFYQPGSTKGYYNINYLSFIFRWNSAIINKHFIRIYWKNP